MSPKHRGGRRPWRRRVPGLLVALVAAAGCVGVADAALQGTANAAGAGGGSAVIAAGAVGLVVRNRRHRGGHRQEIRLAEPTGIQLAPHTTPLQHQFPVTAPAPVTAASEPIWLTRPPEPAIGANLAAVPDLPPPSPDSMTDTVPHPVVKLFPMRELEPELAAGSMDERVFAALDAERDAATDAALARGRHASATRTAAGDAARAEDLTYRSRHSA